MIDMLSSKSYRIRDLLFEANNREHVVTFGDVDVVDGEPVPLEDCLTTTDELCSQQRLDYIFWLEKFPSPSPSSPRSPFAIPAGINDDRDREVVESSVIVIDNYTDLEPFFVDKSRELPFTQLSHRYGIVTALRVLNEKEAETTH